MNQVLSRRRAALAGAVAAVLAFGTVSQVHAQASARAAQERANERQSKKGAKAQEELYPAATRKAPDLKPSAKIAPQLQKLTKLYDDEKGAEMRTLADQIIANDKANAYEKSFAAQFAMQAANDADDTAGAIGYLQKAIELDGLDNNSHYNAMFNLAQLQMTEDKYADALKTMDRFLSETKSQKPEHLVTKGNALYRLEKFTDAIPVLKQAIAASPEPKKEWMQLLMASYFDANQSGEAVKLAETIAAKNPADKTTQMNLVAAYQQDDKFDKAAVVLEKLRAAGQLTDEKDYEQLYITYANLDGHEKQTIEVINEGLKKGAIKPGYKPYIALAQAYYYSDQTGPAIDAYKKAAPLAADGEVYLNLAKVLWAENRIPEAKEAAKQAMAKGIKKPEDAKKIVNLKTK